MQELRIFIHHKPSPEEKNPKKGMIWDLKTIVNKDINQSYNQG